MSHREPDRHAREALAHSQEKTVFLGVHELGVRQKPVGKHRRHGERDEKRCENRHDVGDAERREEFSLHAFEGEERHEHEDDQDRAENDRVADLAAGLVHDPQGRLRIGCVGVLAKPAEDVFHVHDGVIHQLADGHRQAAERHGVDRHATRLEDEASDHDRQWNRRERDERRPKIEKEEEQHDDHENATVAEGLDDVLDREIDERLLLIDLGIDLNVFGKRAAQVCERRGHVVGEPPCVGAGLLGDDEDHRGLAVDRGIAPLHLGRLGHAGHLTQHDRALARPLHHDRLEVMNRLDATEGADEQLVTPLVQIAAGGVGVARPDGGLDLLERHAELEELLGIDEHLELLPAPPHRHDLGDAGDREQPLPHHPVGERSDFDRRSRAVLAPHADVHHLAHDRRDRGELGPYPLGHPIDGDGHLLRHDLAIDIDVGSPLELDVDDREPDARRAAHCLHARGPVEHALERKRYQRLDLFRCEPRRLGHDRHSRTIEVGKHVDRQGSQRDAAIHQHDEREHDRDQAKAKGTFDDGVEHRRKVLGRLA